MGLLDFLNPRKGIAKWAVRQFKKARATTPGISDPEIIQIALNERYKAWPPRKDKALILEERRHSLKDIHQMCHLIAEVEFDEVPWIYESPTKNIPNNLLDTWDVIDNELRRLGY